MTKLRKIIFLLLAVTILLGAAGGAYLSDFYRPDDLALEAMGSDDSVTVTVSGNMAVFSPAQAETGFIFYPGGKVAYTAYGPLMKALARENILCVLLEMPGNLAVLDADAASGIPGLFPEIKHWYIGGHSLGGSMAASWAADNPEMVEGLALLAAYSTADLRETGLKVLSIYGSEDRVLNREKLAKYRSNLPQDVTEYAIPGANHAQFGSYGPQEGDGAAAITAGQQLVITVEALLSLMQE